MDNFIPFSSSNANTLQDFSMDIDNNHSPFMMTIPTYDDHHQVQTHQFLPPYSSVMNPQPVYLSEYFPHIPVTQTTSEFGSLVSDPCLPQGRAVGFFPPHMTKMSRINRKNAMFRSRQNSIPSSTPNEMAVSNNMKNNVHIPDIRGLYRYFTFDKKKIRVLCVKNLRNSDISPLGRIVLPKREAEVNLPVLTPREGILLVMRDVFSFQTWCFKYKLKLVLINVRYWANNKSRIYVLENAGEFVKQIQAEMEDSLTIYEDESKNLYYALRKSGNQNVGSSSGMNQNEDVVFDYTQREEEEDSIAMLIGNLNGPTSNDLMDLNVDFPNHQASSSAPPVDHAAMASSDDQMNFDDFMWS